MGRVHPLAICALALMALPFGLAQAGDDELPPRVQAHGAAE